MRNQPIEFGMPESLSILAEVFFLLKLVLMIETIGVT